MRAGSVIAATGFLILMFLTPVMASPKDARLTAIICLDGIPFQMMDRLKKEGVPDPSAPGTGELGAGAPGRGLFADFHPPSRLISTFPAITEIMLTEFFQVEEPPGYGLRYYDEDSNVLRGGLGDLDAISVWYQLYDRITPMMDRGLVYLWARWADRDLTELETRLRSTDSGVLLIHIDATDALMHHERPIVTERWLHKLDALLTRMKAVRGDTLDILFFSDHGNDMTPSRRIPIEAHLKARGWNPGSAIRGDSGIAILPTGLISTGYLYTRHPAAVAEDLADLPGLDFALYDESGSVHIVADRGRARIDRDTARRGGEAFRYVRERGDPLELDTITRQLEAEGIMDTMGWAADSAWFAATVTHEYPDVLRRAWDGATGHVKNVGDVLLSLKNGWFCGSRMLSALLNFQGTHGSLTRGSITGFWMSNRRDLPECRAEDALDVIGWRAMIEQHAGHRGVRWRHASGCL